MADQFSPDGVTLQDSLGGSVGTPSAPISVLDQMATVEHLQDQAGADQVLPFTTNPADFIMVDVDNAVPTDYTTYRVRVTITNSQTPNLAYGFVCRSGGTTYIPYPTDGHIKAYAPTGTVVAVQVGRYA